MTTCSSTMSPPDSSATHDHWQVVGQAVQGLAKPTDRPRVDYVVELLILVHRCSRSPSAESLLACGRQLRALRYAL
jgi:hypothetical protein